MNLDKFAQAVARSAGRPLTVVIAAALVIIWAIGGPIFGFFH